MPASYGGASGGGASLPDDPAAVLLDAANAGKAVGLAPGTGEGSAVAFGDLVGAGVGEATALADEGDFLVGDGAGGSQLASAAAAAVRTVIGATGLPSGTGFVTVSSGTGGVLTAASTSAADLRSALGPTVPTAGALHHWRLTGAGPWSDLGSGATTLSATGSSWLTDRPGVSIWRGGVVADSPATGDRLSASTTIASGASLTLAITTGARTVNDPTTWSSVRWLIVAWDGSTVTRNLLCILSTAGSIYVSSGVAGSAVSTGSVVVDWTVPHRLVVTHVQSTGAITLYIDGYSRVTATDTGTRGALNTINVGGTSGNAFSVATGLAVLGDAQVWTSALTAAQVLTDWEAARGAMGR